MLLAAHALPDIHHLGEDRSERNDASGHQ
jgi:hypothetical protein